MSQGYRDGYLRLSTLDPVDRVNYGDKTPAIIHFDVVSGDRLKLVVLPKGFGGENMSRVVLFHPAVGLEGVKDYEKVEKVFASDKRFIEQGFDVFCE